METRWLYRTSEDFAELREASRNVCVIPMGCVEKHGLHLPLGTDALAASRIAHMASQIETFCVFPDFTFGDIPNNAPSIARGGNMTEGNVTLPVETYMTLLELLCEQISRNGYNKILIFNGHGGNTHWLHAFLHKLSNKKRDFVAGFVEIGLPAPHPMAEYLEKNGPGSIPELTPEDEALLIKYHKEHMVVGHACMSETACMMAIAPDAVHMDKLGIESGLPTGKSTYLREVGIEVEDGGWGLEFPNAYSGTDPIGCNERIGRACLRIEAERLAKAARVFKEDTYLLELLEQRQKGW